MRPNGQEVLRGVQNTLVTYILPELQSDYARTELMIVHTLVGIVAEEWDGVAQRLVDDNAALRELARRGVEALASRPDASALVDELRLLAGENDASLRLSDLSAAKDRVHDAIGRVGAYLQGAEEPELRDIRAAIIERLREDAERRSRPLMGPRADG